MQLILQNYSIIDRHKDKNANGVEHDNINTFRQCILLLIAFNEMSHTSEIMNGLSSNGPFSKLDSCSVKISFPTAI